MRDNGRSDESAGLEPGQIWLIEIPVTGGLSALDRDVLCRADAVLYEGALAPLIADVLLANSYAEPLSAEVEEGPPAISSRALKLASDGWSVVQLIQPCHQWRQRLRGLAGQLVQLNGTGNLAIRLIAKTAAAPFQIREARLCDLPELVDGADEDEPLTAIIGPLAAGASTAAYGFTANGLAG
jgi:hypothetical protein